MDIEKKDESHTSASFEGKRSMGDIYVIIVAGGNGSRMNSAVPKQFLLLNGRPVLMHTIEKFYNTLPDIHIIVVLAEEYNLHWADLCHQYNFTIKHELAPGGETRFHSVKSGLAKVPIGSLVGIHDAARPLVSAQTIRYTFEGAAEKGNAVPAVSIHDSIREVDGEGNKMMNREKLRIIQTPQCFRSTLIKEAFSQNYSPLFTDDASVAEEWGMKINLVEGNSENIKITTPQDLIIATALL
jgi:2-C-methyl-D-erythritol 4-phosphate cytidylyltransferase